MQQIEILPVNYHFRSLNTRSSHEKFVQMVKDVELAFQQDLDGLQGKTTQKIVKEDLSQPGINFY